MSKQRMLDTINLRNTDKIAHNETLEHPAFIKQITGIDPFEYPMEAAAEAIRVLDLDWSYGLPKRANKFALGETKRKLGENYYVTEWGYTGSGWTQDTGRYTEEDILNYDPFAPYDNIDQVYDHIRLGLTSTLADQAYLGEAAAVTGLYYTTLFQWFIMTFGWEMFLVTAASEPERFKLTLDRFADMSVAYAKVWAQSDLPFFFCHDDIAMTSGLVFGIDWYRKNIFPHYERIFHEVRKCGKKVIFVSDGNFTSVIDDLISVGADGILVDYIMNMEPIARRYGKDRVLIGNMNVQILTFGTMKDVKKEVMRCIDIARDCPGYILKCSNDLPHNIPLANIECYFDTIANHRIR